MDQKLQLTSFLVVPSPQDCQIKEAQSQFDEGAGIADNVETRWMRKLGRVSKHSFSIGDPERLQNMRTFLQSAWTGVKVPWIEYFLVASIVSLSTPHEI